jgi:gamma-glutamyltranspeptidase / glutathione hydrolase
VTICEILQILHGYNLHDMGFHSAAAVHAMAEAMRLAYRDRNNKLGDPDFVHNPVDELVSATYADRLRAGIDSMHATPSAQLPADKPEGQQTTQYSVIDEHGNAVSVTYTLNSWFGARLVAPGIGIVMNDEMDDFTSKPGVPNHFGLVQGAANAIEPGKTPLSSMSPTIVTKDGRVVMVIGSPGGSRIITVTLEAISNVIDYGMTIQEAIDAPRVHMQWLPDTIFVERFALSPDTRRALEAEGYRLTDSAPWGVAEGIVTGAPRLTAPPGDTAAGSLDLGTVRLPGAAFFGAHDPRGPAGLADGY